MTIFRRAGTVCFIATLVVGLTACVENRGSVTIYRNAVPSTDCVADPSTDSYRSSGRLDLSDTAFAVTQPHYDMFPIVQNNLASSLDNGSLIENNVIEIVEARIDLDSGSLPGFESMRFKQPTFVTLMPGDQAGIQVTVIPANVAATLRSAVQGFSPTDTAIVRVRLKFLYEHGGLKHESHQIEYGIQLCNECLFHPGGSCSSGDYADLTYPGNLCNLSQDSQVQCCADNGGHQICPAVDTSTAE